VTRIPPAAIAPAAILPVAILPVTGVALVALIGAGQSLHGDAELRIGSDTTLMWFVAMQMAAVAIYFVAVAGVLRGRPARFELGWVLAVAVAMRVIPLCGAIFLSSDLFRYIWDGRVQLAGINPYQYLPIDPTLEHLRDTAIFSHVSRASYARTIYPPMAQVVFLAVAWISQTPEAMRLAMVAFEALAVAALARALALRGERPGRVLIYAWNPLAVWEFAGNGHVDAIAIGLLAVALLLRTLPPRAVSPVGTRLIGTRLIGTGVALAAATLVKFLPVVAAPALWRRGDWRAPLAGCATIAILYACYAGAGWHVFGFASGYADEEGMADGSGIWVLAGLSRLIDLPAEAGLGWAALVGLGFAAATLWLARHPAADPARAAAWMMLAVMLALSPHYPWYYPWLAVPAVLAPVRASIWLGSAALLLYLSPLHERFIWPALLYVPALVLACLDLRRALAPAPTLALATGQ
jgi:hypothetical protein